jgi:hypothetical protein
VKFFACQRYGESPKKSAFSKIAQGSRQPRQKVCATPIQVAAAFASS